MSTRIEIIQRVTREWEQEHADAVVPDPQYAVDGSSQYPEGIVFLSAGPEADAELHRRIQEALTAEGHTTF